MGEIVIILTVPAFLFILFLCALPAINKKLERIERDIKLENKQKEDAENVAPLTPQEQVAESLQQLQSRPPLILPYHSRNETSLDRLAKDLNLPFLAGK